MDDIKKNATFSTDRKYRYILSRIWDNQKGTVLFICLNPSTADETSDDPTLRRCMNFAKSWGYGGIFIANLFAYRATNPTIMKKIDDPIGKNNDAWLDKLVLKSDIQVAAWGNDGLFMDRGKKILKKYDSIYFLKMNKSGEPAHPLYLKSSLKPQKFKDL